MEQTVHDGPVDNIVVEPLLSAQRGGVAMLALINTGISSRDQLIHRPLCQRLFTVLGCGLDLEEGDCSRPAAVAKVPMRRTELLQRPVAKQRPRPPPPAPQNSQARAQGAVPAGEPRALEPSLCGDGILEPVGDVGRGRTGRPWVTC